jgi:hypothetical protein
VKKKFWNVINRIPEYNLLIVCVCRSPDGQFENFLGSLESVIQKLWMKDRILLLSVTGTWIRAG